MKGKFRAHSQWFCSLYCLRKYESEKKLTPLDEKLLCQEGEGRFKSPGSFAFIFRDKLFLTLLAIAILFAVSGYVQSLRIFRHHFLDYAGTIGIPLLLGFLFGGLIEVYIPRSYVTKVLARNSPKTILNAAMLGFIFSGCSHGCLAIAMELYKKGASVPAIISFLLASPWANVSITFLLFGFFGAKAVWILVGAIFVSLVTGGFYLFLDKRNLVEKNPNRYELDTDFSIIQDIKNRWKNFRFSAGEILMSDIPKLIKGSWHLARMVLWWVLIGITLASLIGAFLKPSLFQKWMGKSVMGMAVTLGCATLIEICSEGSAPLAFEIYRQTQAFGNTFVFLMAGVITDYTEIGLLWTNIGRKTALWLLLVSVPLTLLVGLLMNLWL